MPGVYFNIEWNVIGGDVDNFRPNGPKKPRTPVWDAEAVEIAGRWVGNLNDDPDLDSYWLMQVTFPLGHFARSGCAHSTAGQAIAGTSTRTAMAVKRTDGSANDHWATRRSRAFIFLTGPDISFFPGRRAV